MNLIYLDYAATTPLSQIVKKSMLNSIASDGDFLILGHQHISKQKLLVIKLSRQGLKLLKL